jgi:hypothetical protein
MRTSTISAACIGRLPACCTSVMPLSSICHIRDSTRIDSFAAKSRPRCARSRHRIRRRRRRHDLDARDEMGRIRRGRPAPSADRRRCRTARATQRESAEAMSPRINCSNRSMMRARSARPSMAARLGAPCRRRMGDRLIEQGELSRTEPSPARAIRPSASGSKPMFSRPRCPRDARSARRLDAAQVEALAARQHRHRHLADLGGGEDELDVGGGSSSVFRKALNAAVESMCTSSMM